MEEEKKLEEEERLKLGKKSCLINLSFFFYMLIFVFQFRLIQN